MVSFVEVQSTEVASGRRWGRIPIDEGGLLPGQRQQLRRKRRLALKLKFDVRVVLDGDQVLDGSPGEMGSIKLVLAVRPDLGYLVAAIGAAVETEERSARAAVLQ